MLCRDVVRYQLLPLLDIPELSRLDFLDAQVELLTRLKKLTIKRLVDYYVQFPYPPFCRLLSEKLDKIDPLSLPRVLSEMNEPKLLDLVKLTPSDKLRTLNISVSNLDLRIATHLAEDLGLGLLSVAPIGRAQVLLNSPLLIQELKERGELIGRFLLASLIEGGHDLMLKLTSNLGEIPRNSLDALEPLLPPHELYVWRSVLEGDLVNPNRYDGRLKELIEFYYLFQMTSLIWKS